MGSLGEFQPFAPCPLQAGRDPQALARIAALLAEAETLLQEDTQSAYFCIEQAMALLRREHACGHCNDRNTGGLARWQTRRLDQYIDRNLATPIRTCTLAVQLNLSASHFSHAFKQTFGITPLAYVARKRIEAAQEVMRSSDAPLTQIAQAHGFCDQSYFSRTFRRETGLSPLMWRQRCAAKTPAATES